MSSLATLAHAAAPAAPAFNGLFYATAATVIPVLFLAIAVQGPLYSDLLKTSAKAYRRYRARADGSGTLMRTMAPWLGSVIATGAAVLILYFGVAGEIFALVSLSRQQAYGDPQAPIAAAVLLTVAAAAGPALALARMFATIFPRRGSDAGASTAGEPNDGPRHERPPLAER